MQEIAIPQDEREFRAWLEQSDPHSLAHALNRASGEVRAAAVQALGPEKRRRVFGMLEPANQAEALKAIPDDQRRLLLDEMEPDDRARLLGWIAGPEADAMMAELAPDERAMTERLLHYPVHSAGRIMTPEFVRLTTGMTVTEALEAIRAGERRAETVYFMPVADGSMRLVGTVDLATLVLAPQEAKVGALASDEVPAVRVSDDQEYVARLMKSADLMVVPVVEEDGRLAGIVTFDDAMEVLEFEEGEDFARTGAAEPIGRPYLAVPVLRLVRSRIVWLSVLAVAATLTVNVLGAFEDTLDQVVSLALFIPLLIGIGGNTGAQSATTIVRALALGDVRPRDAARIAFREVRTGLAMGLVIAIVGFLFVSVFFDQAIGIIVAATLVAVCGLAALVGSLMPIVARIFSIDPAVFSAPFVTTVVDATGLLVYFLIARAVLGI